MPTTEIRRIQDQVRRAVMGGAWHGASLSEILADLSAEEASARPVPGAHTPKEFDRYFMLHGVVQHTLYHAGQIVILKKALDEGESR